MDRRWISSNYESFKQIETSVIFFSQQKCREDSNITRITNSLARLDGEKIARKGIGGRKMKISFSRSAITRHEARDRSLEHELIEKWWGGGTRFEGYRGRGKGKKETEVGGSPPLLVTPLYIAHFWLAYMRLFARTSTTKRSPYEGWRAVGWKGLVAALRRVTRRNKYNIMQTGGADRARQSLENLGNPE